MKRTKTKRLFTLLIENFQNNLVSVFREFYMSRAAMDKCRPIYKELSSLHSQKTDALFMLLMIGQWLYLAGLVLIQGAHAKDVFLVLDFKGAIYLASGSTLALLVFYLGIYHSGTRLARHGIAASQMLFSTLICHATGGGGASYIHLFGSLAFLAFYRDPNVILSASVVTILKFSLHWMFNEHMGGQLASGWKLVELSTWILAEDIFLVTSCMKGRLLLRQVSLRQSELLEINREREQEIILRTHELKESLVKMEEQNLRIEAATKMAVLGEMSAGFAHEINNPLAIIKLTVDQLHELAQSEEIDRGLLKELAQDLVTTTARTIKIVKSLKTYGREGKKDPFREVSLQEIVQDTVEICRGKFRSTNIRLDLEINCPEAIISCRSVQISQVLLNLLQNSIDSIEGMKDKWIKVVITKVSGQILMSVTDSGPGIPQEIREEILKPFFTTKEPGKGTGLGLSLCRGIMEDHQGVLAYDPSSDNTRFLLTFPEIQNESRKIS